MTAGSIAASELLLAVLVASVMGSLHCVGMCGPFALMASGASSGSSGPGAPGAPGGRRRATVMLCGYHLGRLMTYLVAGAIAGAFGAALSASGQWLGIQSAAARVAGGMMIALGVLQLVRWATVLPAGDTKGAGNPTWTSGWTLRVSGWIARTRPVVNRLPGPFRALAIGALTTLLPCGWLYLFLLVAAGTGTALAAALVMFAFWLGTLPGLTALVVGAVRMAPRMRGVLPVAGALLLVVTGLYTATGRAAADMSRLTGGADPLQTLQTQGSEPLPCCVVE